MLDHLALQVADVEASLAFYLGVLSPLGVRESMRYERDGGLVVGMCGPSGFPEFWIGPIAADNGGGGSSREVHVAFTAPDRGAVEAVYRAALQGKAEVLHAPRERPEYHPGYYGVFLRDLDGNNVEAVHHGFPER